MQKRMKRCLKLHLLTMSCVLCYGTAYADPTETLLDFPAMHADAEIERQVQEEQENKPVIQVETSVISEDELAETETETEAEITTTSEEDNDSGLTFGGIFGSVRDLFVEEDEETETTIYDEKTVAPSQATITHRPIKPVEEAKIFVHTPEKPDVYPVPSIRPLANWDKPLSEDTIQKYKKIYEYQRLARWDDADNVFGQLDDMRLRGHALYDRYMDANYRSEFEELAAWLDLYADHPKANKIYKLALARMPTTNPWPLTKPYGQRSLNKTLASITGVGKRYVSSKRRSTEQKRALNKLTNYIERDLSKGAPTQALTRLKNSPSRHFMDKTEMDIIKARIAASYLHAGAHDKAFSLAIDVAERSSHYAPMAAWVAGMVCWTSEEYAQAAIYFEQVARSRYASSWTVSAGAYWASRAHMRTRNLKKVSKWLKIAAAHPRTFYGLLATRALGQDFDFNWDQPVIGSNLSFKQSKNARRADLLVQIGRYYEAEQELRLVPMGRSEKDREALLAYAVEIGLPAYAMRFGSAYERGDGKLYDAALYPKIPWKPKGGYIVDEALLNALVRQESRFNTAAVSFSGAVGLMQLMPNTAHHINRSASYTSRAGKERLADPYHNVELGQKYVRELLNMEAVNHDLLSMAIAYNAGPGNLRKWKSQINTDDALYFIENIPAAETRAFVERVLSNFWIYRLQNGQPTPTLDDVTSGRWTRYTPMDSNIKTAKN